MIKRDELTNPESCMYRAREDEMTFVLLSRDEAAPVAIQAWIDERIRLGKNACGDAQIVDAHVCALEMRDQQRKRRDFTEKTYEHQMLCIALAREDELRAALKLTEFQHQSVLEAAGRIEKLQARVEELEAANRWISVDERFPEMLQEVDVWVRPPGESGRRVLNVTREFVDEDEDAGPGWTWMDTDGECEEFFTDEDYSTVTHWRPLPQPPEGTTKETA